MKYVYRNKELIKEKLDLARTTSLKMTWERAKKLMMICINQLIEGEKYENIAS